MTYQPSPLPDEEKPAPKVAPPQYGLNDLLALENKDNYSAFGKMIPSKKPTEPKYGFGKATRDKQGKVFQSKVLVKQQFLGKTGPAPIYEVTDKFKYDKAPGWNVQKGPERNTLDTKPKYEHYLGDIEIERNVDVHNADLKRRKRAQSAKFGTASRFPGAPNSLRTPGPIYNPGFDPKRPTSSKYSFGFRREIPGYSPLANMSGTQGRLVGPSTYFRGNKMPLSSRLGSAPAHKFPEGLRTKARYGSGACVEAYED